MNVVFYFCNLTSFLTLLTYSSSLALTYFSQNSLFFSLLFYFLGGGRFAFFALSQKIQCIVGGEAAVILAEHHKTKRAIK